MALKTSETGPEKQLKRVLGTVVGTLLMLQRQDLRMGARPLYRDPQFVAAVTQYFIAVNKTFDTKFIEKTQIGDLKRKHLLSWIMSTIAMLRTYHAS